MYRTVKYELLSLEAWLTIGKRPDRALSGKIKAEASRIREALLVGVLTLTDELHVQRYVRTHHYGIIQLLNKRWNKEESRIEITNALTELLATIENSFHQHVDPQSELSHYHRQQVSQQCKETLQLLHQVFAKSTLPLKLQAAISSCFRELEGARTITYQQKNFALVLTTELHNQLAIPDPLQQDAWSKFLMSTGCNTDTAFDYWRARIVNQMNNIETRVDKREYLTSWIREIEFIPIKSDRQFTFHTLPLRDQLLAFMTQELHHLESSWQTKTISNNTHESFRLRTELSVSQLACFVKALVDTRIIVNPNISELLRLVAQTIISKRAESISFDSLRAKYYNIESGTREALRETLHRILTHL
jgi:hypothetical protein